MEEKMKKAFKVCGSILSWLIIIVLAVAIMGVAIPEAMGVKMYTVLTGSMQPTYNVGDLVYVAPTPFNEIKVGDTVTYIINSQGTVVTHRVIQKDETKGVVFTKGDNNSTPDGREIQYQNIVGVVKFSVPKIGRAVAPLLTLYGKVAAICAILIMVILINLIPYLLSKKEEDEEENNNEEK